MNWQHWRNSMQPSVAKTHNFFNYVNTVELLIKYLILLVPFFLVTTAWAEIYIQNDRQYIGDDGSLHIVGEIQNGLDVPLNKIDIQATLYSEERVLDVISSNSFVNTIMPQMAAPFDLIISGSKADLVEAYSLDLDYEIASPKSQVIDITSSEMTKDKFDNLIITGTVTNKGEFTANVISVVATLYDRDGNVAAVSKTLTKPDYLRSDDEIFFLMSVSDKSQTEEVVDYSLVAESEEYAAVPEFPLSTSLLLASSVSAYIGITRYSGRFIANQVSASDLR